MASGSIVDFLNGQGQDSSFAARAKLAASKGISNYTGSAAQNTQLLGMLQSAPAASSAPASSQYFNTPAPGSPGSFAASVAPPGTAQPSSSSNSSYTPPVQLPPIPDSVYSNFANMVGQGLLTPQAAQQQIQNMVGSIYSGAIDTQKLFPAGQSFTKPDGTTVAFDNTGTGNFITTGRSTQQETVTKDGITSGVAYDPGLAKFGITQDVWNSLNASQQATIGAAYNAGTTIQAGTGNSVTVADALAAAAKDPNIIAKYGDALALDKTNFAQTLQQIQTAVSVQSSGQQQQFENDRKQLADMYASNGAAYSGFRGNAQSQLASSEQNVVTSSRAQLQKQLDDATAAFEQKYGTAATTAATASFMDPFASSNYNAAGQYMPSSAQTSSLSGALTGGITGTDPIAKQGDIASEAAKIVAGGVVPNVVPA